MAENNDHKIKTRKLNFCQKDRITIDKLKLIKRNGKNGKERYFVNFVQAIYTKVKSFEPLNKQTSFAIFQETNN